MVVLSNAQYSLTKTEARHGVSRCGLRLNDPEITRDRQRERERESVKERERESQVQSTPVLAYQNRSATRCVALRFETERPRKIKQEGGRERNWRESEGGEGLALPRRVPTGTHVATTSTRTLLATRLLIY